MGQMLKDQRERNKQVTPTSYLANSSTDKGLNSCLLPPYSLLSTQPYHFLSVQTSRPLWLTCG